MNTWVKRRLMALGMLDEAETQFRIVEAFVRDPEPNGIMDLWRYAQHLFASLGELSLLRHDSASALAYVDECLEIVEPAQHRKNIVKARRLRGRVLLTQGKLEGAERELEKALELATEVRNPPQLWESHLAMGELCAAQGRRDEGRACRIKAEEVLETVAATVPDELGARFRKNSKLKPES